MPVSKFMVDDLDGITGINIDDDVVAHLSSHKDKHGHKANSNQNIEKRFHLNKLSRHTEAS